MVNAASEGQISGETLVEAPSDGVCFWPGHRGRRRSGWDVSEGRREEARTRQVVV